MKRFLFFFLLLSVLSGCQKSVVQEAPSGPVSFSVPSIPKEDMQVEFLPSSSTDVSEKGGETKSVEPSVSSTALSFEDIEKMAFEYEVQSGETLSEIASKYDVGVGLLQRLNHIENPHLLRVGKKLKVIQGPFRIVVHKKDKTLTLFLKDQYVKAYPVATGREDSTPEGDFKIMNKMIRPTWTDPYSRAQIKADDPRYPLGTRWMQFAPYGYGIHGTHDPSSIGEDASFGCIRMVTQDAEELYDRVSIGSQVLVVP